MVVRAKKGTDGNNRKASCERRNKNSQTNNDPALLLRVLDGVSNERAVFACAIAAEDGGQVLLPP